MPGRADNQGFFALGAKRRDVASGVVGAEVNDHIPAIDDRAQIIAKVDLANNTQFRIAGGTGDKRLSHAAFGTRDNDV